MSRRILILSMMLLPARSTGQENPRHSFNVIQEDNLTIAVTGDGPRYTQPLFEYRELLHLNQDPQNTESLLFRPRQFVRGPDGCYYVIDSGNHRVAVFDERGEYQRSFGSEGGGPGAYRSMGFQGLHDGILHIQDINMRRTTRVKLDGAVIEILTMPRPQVINVPKRYRLSDGRQLLLSHLNEFGRKQDTQRASATIVSAEYDTLFHTTTDPVVIAIVGYLPSQPDQRSGLMVHFPGFPCSEYSADHGIFLSDGRHPVIHRYDTSGEYTGRIELDQPPRSVPRQERRWLIDRVNRQIQQFSGIQREHARMSRDMMTIADPIGYWAQMYVDNTGYIWLSVVENWFGSDNSRDEHVCDIFSPAGEYLGRTALPESLDKCIAVDGYLCVMHRDRDTGEYDPTIYQIVPAVDLDYP